MHPAYNWFIWSVWVIQLFSNCITHALYIKYKGVYTLTTLPEHFIWITRPAIHKSYIYSPFSCITFAPQRCKLAVLSLYTDTQDALPVHTARFTWAGFPYISTPVGKYSKSNWDPLLDLRISVPMVRSYGRPGVIFLENCICNSYNINLNSC